MCKKNVISVTVPNVTGVPNVTSSQMYRKCPKIILVCQKCTKKLLGVLINVVYQPVYQTSHAPKCTKCTKTHQGLCLACKKSATSVTVPNVTGVPNVTSTQNVPKMTKNHFELIQRRISHTQTAIRRPLKLPSNMPSLKFLRAHKCL